MSEFDVEGLMTPPTDKDWLHAWIKEFLDLDLPNQTVSRFSDSNPMDALWEIFSDMMEGRPAAYMCLAGRDASKTLLLSVLDVTAMIFDKRDPIHVAMTLPQANRARGYLDKYVDRNPPIAGAVVKRNTTEIKLKIDNEVVGMELLPAKPKSVQGAHGSLLSFDELASSMEPQNLKAIKDAHGMVSRGRNGKPAIIVKITSRQAGHTLAEKELRSAAKTGLKVRKWTTLDCTERCLDDRSGTVPAPLWLNHMKGEAYTEKEFLEVPHNKKEGFVRVDSTFDKCRECPLVSICQGDLKKQKSTSPVLRGIDDVILKIRQGGGSWDWALAQIMSLKPSSESLIYFEYDPKIHVPGWNAMWRTLTGSDRSKDVTREDFVRELKLRGGNFYAGVDWGWSNPSTCVVIGVDRRDNVYVLEAMGRTYTNDPAFIELIKQKMHSKYDIQMYGADTANGSGGSLLRQAHLPVPEKLDKSIYMGINVVKGFLRVAGTNNQSKIFFAPDLNSEVEGVAGILEEMELYHKQVDVTGKIIDDVDPADEYDHYMDALRYIMVWLFGKAFLKIGTDYAKETDPTPNRRLPGAGGIIDMREIAKAQGVSFEDNSGEEPTGGSDDEGGGSGGGFDFRFT